MLKANLYREYISAHDAWSWVDAMSSNLDLAGEHSIAESSELAKLVLFGKREMLDAIIEFLGEHERTLH